MRPVQGGMTKAKEAETLMAWLVVYMTVIFPVLLVVLLVSDLVDFKTKPLESPLRQRQNRIHR